MVKEKENNKKYLQHVEVLEHPLRIVPTVSIFFFAATLLQFNYSFCHAGHGDQITETEPQIVL